MMIYFYPVDIHADVNDTEDKRRELERFRLLQVYVTLSEKVMPMTSLNNAQFYEKRRVKC